MEKVQTLSITLTLLLIIISCVGCINEPNQGKEEPQIIREPAVAGGFYPGDKTTLTGMIGEYLDNVDYDAEIKNKNILGMVAPHAGYVFSGSVAASSFNQINPKKKYKTIFIIGSSHRTTFDGASIYNKGNYITPLGTVNVDLKIANNLINKYDVFKYKADAHEYEHSLEVQLPFLQHIMENEFNIVPIVVASPYPETCKEISKALKPYFNENNLFIINMRNYLDEKATK